MFLLLCLLATVSLGRCLDHLPTREEIEISINRTIQEVEKKIQADPSLPKLSRKDIVDILQNITTKDLISDYKILDKTRNDYQRALMVVLPYNSNGAEEHLKDLYTRPPIIQMLSDDDVFHEQERNRISSDENSLKKQVSDNFIPTFPTAVGSIHESPLNNQQYSVNNKEKVDSKLEDSKPEKFSFDLEKLSEILTTTKRSTHTWRPVPKDSHSPQNVTSVFNSVHNSNSITTEAPISKSTQHILSFDQWHYHPPPTTSKPQSSIITTTTTTTPEPTSSKPQFQSQTTQKYQYPPKEEYFLPTIKSSPEIKYDYHQKEENTNAFKFFESEAMTLPTTKTEQTAAVFVTPMKIQNSQKLSKESSPISTMRPDIEDLLKSIGLRPMKNPNDLVFDKKETETKFQIPDSNNVIYNPTFGLTTAGVDTVSIADQNTFDNSDKIQKGVNNLTPAVQQLFKKFGLPTNLDFQSLTTTTTTTTPTTTMKPTQASYYSYTNFKPLSNSSVRNKEMRDFLAKFGLGEARNQRAMRQNTREVPSLIEAVPMNMKKILENIGLIRPRARIDDDIKQVSRQSTTTIPSKLHVFKPQESSVFNDQQRAKINELLNTVKKVQKGKATIDDVQKVADEVLESTKSLPEGPDPVSLEEILKLYKEDLKNEVKRQQTNEKEVNTNRDEILVKKENIVKKEVANEEKVVGEEKYTNAKEIIIETNITKQNDNTTNTNLNEESSKEKENNKEQEFKIGDKGKKENDDIKETATDDQKLSFSSAASSDSQAAAQDIVYTSVPTTTTSSTTAAKGSFFESFDFETALKNANVEETKNSNANIAALEESFGGTTQKPDPVLPTRRRTGLYFLVDWNTFLEVGDDEKEKVNLRFQPRAGDRTRFLKVTVP
ncbi:mucin-4 isoform X2 [Leptopilina boulardi]|uniref:mucin-4 isoform X2 n=1 Tax=Leptopilina boulardi TaxID=63433 RepID=UPI0021F61426|nr:mucin-4 isoform X2 [Leptopilina boulardi]